MIVMRFRNPKRTKHELKFLFFYLWDFVIFVATVFIGNMVMDRFNLSPVMTIVNYIFLIVLGVWFCFRTPSHPIDRNLYMVLYYMFADKSRYYNIQLKNYESQTKKNDKEAN